MKKLGAIVVGFGHLGNFHAQKYASLAEEGVELIGIVDPRGEELRAKAEKVRSGVPLFSNLEAYWKAVSSGQVEKADLASVATPTEHHLEVALQLIEKEIPVLVEKPLTRSAEEGRRMLEAAARKGVMVATGHVERHRALSAIESMEGQPLFVECHRLSPFPARSVDIDVIFDLMIHDFDLLLAMVKSEVVEVRGAGFPVLTKQIDIANCRLEFANGCVANLTASRISLVRTRKFRVFGKDSYLSMDLASGQFESYRRRSADPTVPLDHSSGKLEVDDALHEEIRDFVRAVKQKSEPLVSGEDGLRAIELAERVQSDILRRLKALPFQVPIS
jgi:predicted dehydrogenase